MYKSIWSLHVVSLAAASVLIMCCGQNDSTTDKSSFEELPDAQSEILADEATKELRNLLSRKKWTLERTMRESDLVVIAKCTSIELVDPATLEEPLPHVFEMATADLQILATLRGKPLEKSNAKVQFYQPIKDSFIGDNSQLGFLYMKMHIPVMTGVKIDSDQFKLSASDDTHLIQPAYLLFLKRSAGDVFIPTSGFMESKYSFIMLSSSLEE